MPGYLSELEDSAAVRFYEELREKRLMTTRCPACDHTFFPPRILCPRCLGEELEWVELSGRGTIYAFTQQHGAMFLRKPDVVGAVELEDAVGRVFTLIDAPLNALEIGAAVEVGFFESPTGAILHRFRPVG
jgi:uncharacterized OB-fold protein